MATATGGNGGNGAIETKTINVTPGSVLTIIVGSRWSRW